MEKLRQRLGRLGMEFNEWKCVKLGEVCSKIGSGATPTGGANAYCDSGIALIRSQNILDFNFSANGLAYINEMQAKKLSNVHVDKGDVLLNITGDSVARSCIVPEKMLPARVNQHVAIIRGDQSKVHNRYILYYLQNNKSYLLSIAGTGGTRNALTKKMIESLDMPLPALSEQKSIAAILSCLDDKIELNNRINKTLEEMAQAIFKSWFVDFEPFQDGDFEDSELGRIPKGWNLFQIDDVTSESNTGGDAIQRTPMVDFDTGIKCVRVGDLSNQRGVDGWGFCNVNDENFKKYQLLKNDIIVTRTATLGLNQIIDENLMAVYNNGLIRLKLNEKVIPLFFYYVINTDSYKEYIGCIESESSTRPNMKINYLLKYRFICPPKKLQEEFVKKIVVLREQRLNLYKQIRCLTEIRDSLLPKLMSGEIRVPLEEVQ